jgi:hypothetical protein
MFLYVKEKQGTITGAQSRHEGTPWQEVKEVYTHEHMRVALAPNKGQNKPLTPV